LHAILPMGFAADEFPVDLIVFSSFVIVFWFSFYSHVPESLTTLLSSCFGCVAMPSVAPLPPSCRHRPYDDLASPASGV